MPLPKSTFDLYMRHMKITLLLSILLSIITAAVAAIGEPISYWKKQEIKVCWQNKNELSPGLFTKNQWSKLAAASKELKEMPLAKKQFIKKTIQAEFSKTRTGVHFTGWKSCEQDPNVDTILIIVNSDQLPLGRSSVGRSEVYENEAQLLPIEKKTFVLLNLSPAVGSVLSADAELTYSAIHEFGHLAGLRHENISTEASNDPNCSESEIGPEVSQDSIAYLSSYDSSSIMNYCLYNFIGNAGLKFRTDISGNVLTATKAILFPYKNLEILTDELVIQKIYPFHYKAKLTLSKKDLHGLRCIYLKHCSLSL